MSKPRPLRLFEVTAVISAGRRGTIAMVRAVDARGAIAKAHEQTGNGFRHLLAIDREWTTADLHDGPIESDLKQFTWEWEL